MAFLAAVTVHVEVGDSSRFGSGGAAVLLRRPDPREHSSARHIERGHISDRRRPGAALLATRLPSPRVRERAYGHSYLVFSAAELVDNFISKVVNGRGSRIVVRWHVCLPSIQPSRRDQMRSLPRSAAPVLMFQG